MALVIRQCVRLLLKSKVKYNVHVDLNPGFIVSNGMEVFWSGYIIFLNVSQTALAPYFLKAFSEPTEGQLLLERLNLCKKW